MSNYMRRRFLSCAFIAVSTAAACDNAQPAAEPGPEPAAASRASIQFDTGTVVLRSDADSVVVPVEVAQREDQRAFGLMDRDSLPVDRGMIFLYNGLQDGGSGFWMYRTRIPLDIAFFDAEGKIIAIRQMAPCTSVDPAQCTAQAAEYRPGAPYMGAIELNSGFLRTHGIEVGDRVVVVGR